MKRNKIKGNVRLIGEKNFGGDDKLIDYYILSGNNMKTYAFTRSFTNHTYELTKSGARIEDILFKNSLKQNEGVYSLIKQLKRMLPYLADEYELDIYEGVA